MPLYYLCEQPDVASGREYGSGFVLSGQAAQRKASRGDARQDKPSRCVGQARRERCPPVLKNTVVTADVVQEYFHTLGDIHRKNHHSRRPHLMFNCDESVVLLDKSGEL